MSRARRVVVKIIEGEESHPELGAFNHLFSVDPVKNEKLMEWIGKWVKFTNLTSRSGLIFYLPFKVMHLQKLYDGSIALRVENQLNRFGSPAKMSEVTPISEEEAHALWDKNLREKLGRTFEFTPFDPNFDQDPDH